MEHFADDPAGFFQGQASVAHHLPLDEQQSLQLEALRQRFGSLRDSLAPLTAMANAAGLDEIRSIEDVAPVLFPHSFNKSMPQHLIHEHRFDAMTQWLGRQTTVDLSVLAGRSFETIDAWFDAIDDETGLEITHSSGTTGALSLYPRGKVDIERADPCRRMSMVEWLDPLDLAPDKPDYAVIWPSYPSGRSAILRGASVFRDIVAGNPSLFHALLPGPMSSDWQFYILRLEEARRKEVAPPPPPSDYVRQKMDEAAEIHKSHADRMRHLLDVIRFQFSPYRIVMAGGPINLHLIASEGLKLGMEACFRPGSIVRSFGGLKGYPEPERMEATIKQFTGVSRIGSAYGMTEVLTHFNACAEGNFHIPPWVIPMVLDPASGAMLPRRDRQKGRAAFVDLIPSTYWGGVVSADIIEVDWNRCGCGRSTPHVRPGIARIPDKEGDEYNIGAASPEAIHAAVHGLNWDLG